MTYKTYKHNPPHLFLPGYNYFVTASSWRHKPIFHESKIKEQMVEMLSLGCQKYHWILDDWVFLDDHYHIMLRSDPEGETTIAKLINNFHKFLSLWIRKEYSDGLICGRIFNNYWDTCLTYERSFLSRLNYIYYNPVKHGYVKKPEDYPFGSFYYRVRDEQNYLEKLKNLHPWDNLDLEH